MENCSYLSAYTLFSRGKLPCDLTSRSNLEQLTAQQFQYNDEQRFYAVLDNNVTFEGSAEALPCQQIKFVYSKKS